MSVSEASRTRRLVEGWSANFVQMLLGLTQQVALVPIFLRYWSHEELAAWFVIYAVGNLVTVADGGLISNITKKKLKKWQYRTQSGQPCGPAKSFG